ncbi:MAG: hypothetical protein COX70_08505 [Flavobacteriales bacterium CG_4_10_14_0_2_um_filter_32_8]|nr:MAG: hypothetical protein COX70_08505 [Flavobacteriales bacterium CG_4_10_14_0_2_um_filter_32_8]PJB15633.1 MAG: hypothetical protein CO118_02730 [Flavobacteriales bacterium CG_4_9_14_3_um_filter_32_8]
MKKNKILIILLLLALAAVAAYYYFNNKSGTIGEQEGAKSDFAIVDTTSINKIFIADAQGKTVTLSKINNVWMVDNKYIARPDNIRLLIKTFGRIAVKSPVPKAAFNTVVKSIATGAIKVEIYQGKKLPSKTYYVGGATLDHQGTYMLLETEGVKSTVPFIMHIPGFYGYLTTRFFTQPEQWRDAIVFKYSPKEIKSIEVNYFESPEESFIIRNTDNKFSISSLGSNEIIKNVDNSILTEYVSRYQKIYYEMIDVESSKERIDSIIASPPFFSIEVKDFMGGGNKMVAYHMPNFRTTLNHDGVEFLYDVDRMYGYLNNELFTYIQFATFDQLRLPKSYFIKKK